MKHQRQSQAGKIITSNN